MYSGLKTDFDRWVEELIEYLEELGGRAPLSDPYDYIQEHPKRELQGDWQKRVRFTLYESSSDSKIWKRDKDLFKRIGGERSGVWALREQKEFRIVGDPERFNEDISPALPPQKKQHLRAIFVRNQRLAKELKKKLNYTCERCGYRAPWMTSKGNPYVEAHHLIPLGEEGFDELANLIIVCAECHRYLHYALDRANEIYRLGGPRGLPVPRSLFQ